MAAWERRGSCHDGGPAQGAAGGGGGGADAAAGHGQGRGRAPHRKGTRTKQAGPTEQGPLSPAIGWNRLQIGKPGKCM